MPTNTNWTLILLQQTRKENQRFDLVFNGVTGGQRNVRDHCDHVNVCYVRIFVHLPNIYIDPCRICREEFQTKPFSDHNLLSWNSRWHAKVFGRSSYSLAILLFFSYFIRMLVLLALWLCRSECPAPIRSNHLLSLFWWCFCVCDVFVMYACMHKLEQQQQQQQK